MNRRSLQTIAIVVCAAGLVYSLIVLQKSGTLQAMWSVLMSGAYGGFPL